MSRLDNGGVPVTLSISQATAESQGVVIWLKDHPGTIDVECPSLLDARVYEAEILTADGVPLKVDISGDHQELVTVQCPFQGAVDVDWRYQSVLRNQDEEQVGDWTCPLCGETREVVR